jgi:hypothetical protein
LNDVLINSVFNCNFHKILGSMFIRWTTIGIPGNTVYYLCLILWSVVYCFSGICIFFTFTQHLN